MSNPTFDRTKYKNGRILSQQDKMILKAMSDPKIFKNKTKLKAQKIQKTHKYHIDIIFN